MMEQGSEAWHAARLGKVTASRIADLMATTKSGPSASRANYLAQLVCERLTGKPAESFCNGAMQWGTDQEPFARALYEMRTNVMVDQVGFVDHPTIAMSGASPDGLVGDDGLIEIKCPNQSTHKDYLISQVVPAKYKPQMAWQLICTGRKWCDFVSFDPRWPERLQLFVVRYEPSFEYLKEIECAVVGFLNEVAAEVKILESIANQSE